MKKVLTIIFKGTDIQEVIELDDLTKAQPTFKDIEKYIRQKSRLINQTFNKKIIFEYLNLSKVYIELSHDKMFRDYAFRVNYTFYISQEGGFTVPKIETKKEEEKPPVVENEQPEVNIEPPKIEKNDEPNNIVPPPPPPINEVDEKPEKTTIPPPKNQNFEKKQTNYNFQDHFNQPLRYADFGSRLGAYLLDAMIIGVPLGMFNFMLGIISSDLAALTNLIGIILPWLYYAYMESSEHQGTFGKKIVGLKVTTMQGEPVNFGQASGRFFGKFISAFFFIGFIMIGFTEKKQGLHDMFANTLVVHR